jgi:sporulation protein YlmC with PRC-barrel domain
MGAIEKDRMLQFRGDDLIDRDGEKIGRIEEMYLDADSGEPEWALVHTGLLGSKRNFVPLADATEVEGQLRVPLEKAKVKDAPGVDPNGQLTKPEEAKLYAHYGMAYEESE